MKSLEKIIEAYRFSSSDKIQIIEELEFVEVEERWPFLLEIISDSRAEDLEKISVFKILESNSVSEKYVDVFAREIENIILNESDYDIRNYAVIAMKNFVADDIISNLVKKLVLDKNEDIDVRWNAFSALRANIFEELKNDKNKSSIDNILKSLRREKGFEKAVDRLRNYINKKL